MKVFRRTSIAVAWVVLLGDGAGAQTASSCQGVELVEPPAGMEPITVDQVEGQAVFALVGDEHERGDAAGVCLLLFSREHAEPVLAGTTDDGGGFVFPRPAPGPYVLVAAFERIHEFGVPLRISDTTPGSEAERGLLLHLRVKQDDRSSFASVIGSLALRRELVEMGRADQDVRKEMIREGIATPDPEMEARMAAIDAHNTRRLRAIVARYGWPGLDLVAMDGSQAAFLILQHASLAVQKELFPLVEAGYRDGTVTGERYAYLHDRILVGEGKPQVYGTQAEAIDENGEPTFAPIDDEANVDLRRAEVGLPPLAEYRELLRRVYSPDE